MADFEGLRTCFGFWLICLCLKRARKAIKFVMELSMSQVSCATSKPCVAKLLSLVSR